METVTIRSMLSLLVLFGACSLLPAIQANDFWYCTKMFYPVQVHDVEISPQPVVNGNYTTFTMTGIPEIFSVAGGKWIIEISNFSDVVVWDTYSFCEETTCPVEVGQEFTLSKTKIYEWLQPGTYLLTMRISDEGSRDLVCVRSNFEIVDPFYSYIRKISGIDV